MDWDQRYNVVHDMEPSIKGILNILTNGSYEEIFEQRFKPLYYEQMNLPDDRFMMTLLNRLMGYGRPSIDLERIQLIRDYVLKLVEAYNTWLDDKIEDGMKLSYALAALLTMTKNPLLYDGYERLKYREVQDQNVVIFYTYKVQQMIAVWYKNHPEDFSIDLVERMRVMNFLNDYQDKYNSIWNVFEEVRP